MQVLLSVCNAHAPDSMDNIGEAHEDLTQFLNSLFCQSPFVIEYARLHCTCTTSAYVVANKNNIDSLCV